MSSAASTSPFPSTAEGGIQQQQQAVNSSSANNKQQQSASSSSSTNANGVYDAAVMEAIIGRMECNVDTAMSVRAVNHAWLKASRAAWDMKCFTTEVDPKKMYLTEKEDAEGKLMCALELSHPEHVETARRILQGEY